MLIPQLLEQVLIALAIGGLIGVERERLESRKFVGLRTSAILAMGGPISVKISSILSSIVPVIVYIAFGGAVSIVIILIRMNLAKEDIGLTTSASAFVLVLVALLVGYSHYFEAVSISIITTFLLAGKEKIRPYISGLSNDEIISAMKVAAAAFILYPLLPSEPITSLGLINPQKVLLFILLVLGIRFAAFLASRQLPEDIGLPLTGLLGGGVSSLATVGALSEIAKKEENLKAIAFGIVLSTTSMVVRNVTVASLSFPRLVNLLLIPSVLIIGAGVLPSLISLRGENKTNGEKIKKSLRSPLSFRPALELGFYFFVITIIGSALRNFVGQEGLWTIAFFGGLVSSAAVVLSVISMLSSQAVSVQTGTYMVVLACISSIFVKMVLVYTTGNKKAIRKVLPLLLAMFVAGILSIFLI